ncbi:MAG: HAMP domain-containing protein [Bifidobacteriaceae bacterium]|nr:HAMP domain-containing protein [Bifidobacteriaceae bacterium]
MRGHLPVAGGTVLAIIAVGWLLAGTVLRPLRLLAATAHEISASRDLSRRVAVDTRDEVGQLASAFTDMVVSLEAASASERQLLDDVGHELRTPLTIIRGQLEVSDAVTFARARTIALDEVDGMRRMVDSLVTLAQAREAGLVRLEPLALAPLVDDAADKARMLGDRDWRIDARCEVTASADSQRLTQALLRLAANAVKCSGPGSQVGFG